MTAPPIALDLFCCAGGSSCGLFRTGFRVVGVDKERHPDYPFEFVQADLSTTDAVLGVIRSVGPNFISASPPCQRFSRGTRDANREDHPNLIPSTRAAVVASGVPGFIENVEGAPLHNAIRLCGSMFGLRVRRHRYFELIGWYTLEPEHRGCHRRPVVNIGVGGGVPPKFMNDRYAPEARAYIAKNAAGKGCENWRNALGFFRTHDEWALRQAIPPAYTHWLGQRFLGCTTRSQMTPSPLSARGGR